MRTIRRRRIPLSRTTREALRTAVKRNSVVGYFNAKIAIMKLRLKEAKADLKNIQLNKSAFTLISSYVESTNAPQAIRRRVIKMMEWSDFESNTKLAESDVEFYKKEIAILKRALEAVSRR